ncbi:RNA polymerase sigma factor [Paenibacillus sp. GCM10027627]|uniref:RNA polymerase sigma factor n=1 Tax=unclassified Paenibacillus TaxID=185978 RepID=UPI0036259C7A
MKRLLQKEGVKGLGDKADLERLHISLFRYCLVLTGSKWDAEDLSQLVWCKALTALKKSPHHNVEALLLRIAKNEWIDCCRRKAVYKTKVEALSAEERSAERKSSEEDSFAIEAMFGALLNHLSPLQRTVFVFRDALGFSNLETAEKLGLTEGAVKAALHRARKSIEAVRRELESDHGGRLPSDSEERVWLEETVLAYEEGRVEDLAERLMAGVLYASPLLVIGGMASYRVQSGNGFGTSMLSLSMSA